jgi:AraC family transcriptional regulator
MSIGVILHEPIKTDGAISLMTIEKGKHLVGRFEIEVKDFEISWNALFLWMSEQGYKKADRLPYEIYYNNPAEHPENKCIVELCIPVE